MERTLRRALVLTTLLASAGLAQTATAPSAGDGTAGNPYQIADLNNLYWIASNNAHWGEYYIQTANIDASATFAWPGGGWTPIGNSSTYFFGSYDGQGHAIDGLYISRSGSDDQGFFGYATNATIKNLGVTNVNINGNEHDGGLIGTTNNSPVSNCYSTGSVSGYRRVGGLVGYYNSSSVSKCYSACSVSGAYFIGGLVGFNNGTVSNSYSTGIVSASGTVGGLVGYNNLYITNSYSAGSVSGTEYSWGGLVGYNYYPASSTVTGCFWDTQTSGQPSSAAGIGKTTAEMKTQSTFTDAAWDVGIWMMGDGINNGYPYLAWQNTGGTPLPVELISLTTTPIVSGVRLSWNTATETNCFGFDVERINVANDLAQWGKVGFVKGFGTSNVPHQYTFTDSKLPVGHYGYRLKQVDNDGSCKYYQSDEVVIEAPKSFALDNYPNPFNPSTTIRFDLPKDANVSLRVFNTLGQLVATLVDEPKRAGVYQVQWNASNVPSGTYFYRLQTAGFMETRKMIVVK